MSQLWTTNNTTTDVGLRKLTSEGDQHHRSTGTNRAQPSQLATCPLAAYPGRRRWLTRFGQQPANECQC